MASFNKITPGQNLDGIQSADWNGAMDVARAFREGKLEPNRTRPSMPGQATDLGVEMWNDYVVDIPEDYALQVFKAMTNSGETDFLLSPLIESENYTSTYRFNAGSVLHRSRAPAGDGDELIRLYSAGIVPATIYVHDAKHRFVDSPYIGAQIKYWETDWDGPHQILWKESGTGEKKALLRLGSNQPRFLFGRTKEAWRKRGGIPSQGNKWAYVNVELMDYSTGTVGVESDKVVRVLLPTHYDQDPNCPANIVIGFKKCYQRSDGQFFSGFAMGSWPTYRYMAVTNNYASSFIGDTKTVLVNTAWNCSGWVLADGGQDTDKTCSGEAVNASDKFIRYQKEPSDTGGDDTARFLSKDVIDNIANHPDHTHEQLKQYGIAFEGGPDAGIIPDNDTGLGGAAGHAANDDTHEVEIDVVPAWTGARLYERIDNSEGDEE